MLFFRPQNTEACLLDVADWGPRVCARKHVAVERTQNKCDLATA